MSVARLARLIQRAERKKHALGAQSLQLSGYIEIGGGWVNPTDFIEPEQLIPWARELYEAIKVDDHDRVRRLGEIWAGLVAEGAARARQQLGNGRGQRVEASNSQGRDPMPPAT